MFSPDISKCGAIEASDIQAKGWCVMAKSIVPPNSEDAGCTMTFTPALMKAMLPRAKGTFNILSNEKAWLLSFSPASSSISAAYWVSLKNGYELNWHIRLIQTQTERPTALKEIHLNTEINKWATYHPVNLKLYLNDIFSDFFFLQRRVVELRKVVRRRALLSRRCLPFSG